jgi:hypothetical protein
MNSTIQLLTVIDGITVEGDYDASDHIAPFLYFSNDPGVVADLVADETESFRRQFGEINFKKVKESKATVFLQMPCPDSLPANSIDQLMRNFRKMASAFTMFLWVVKDSSASVGSIYFMLNKLACIVENPSSLSSNCKGLVAPVTLQRDDIKSAIGLLQRYGLLQTKGHKPSPFGTVKRPRELRSAFLRDKSRLSKALLMLSVVRQCEDMALKIAHYCSCFEILFSSASDKEAISHKIAERIAVFLNGSANERVAVYEDIRDAYGVRCDVFHGAFLKSARESELERLCVRCDTLLRATLRRILESPEHAALFEDKVDKFDQYFRDCIFGAYAT